MSRSKNIGLQITNAFSCKFAKLNSELENIGLQANAFVERTLKGPHTISFLDFLRLARFKLMQILIFFPLKNETVALSHLSEEENPQPAGSDLQVSVTCLIT